MDIEAVARMLSAGSWLLIVISFVVGLFFLHRLKKGDIVGQAREIAIGVVWVAFGFAMHRLYWGIYRINLAAGNVEVADPMWSWSWVTIFPLAGIALGYGHHLAPVLKPFLGKHYLSKYMGIVLLLFIFAVTLHERML